MISIINEFSLSDCYWFINRILLTIGLWKLFKKSKMSGWWAFVPIANWYYLAKCADREDEANVWGVAHFISNILYGIVILFNTLQNGYSFSGYIVIILSIVFSFINLIYEIRIYGGMCETYGVKKKWILGWMFFEGITAFIWGMSKKHNPNVVFDEVSDDIIPSDAMVSAQEGLSININERVVHKGFVRKSLLKDIHFHIKPGKMVLLLGGSGAGKTTFFNAVTGYEQADATILLDGVDVYKRFDKMKYEIGFVPQQELIRQNDSVYRTLMDSAMLRLPNAVSRKELDKRVKEVMNMFGLTAVKDNIVAKQSGGQKKRISIAMEYISNPSLFILDEPDSGLDGILARELMQRLHDISREGKIVLVITHTPDRVIDLFDQVIVLAKDNKNTGRLVYFGDIDEAKQFFCKDTMEDIVKTINRVDEGGDGMADELIAKFTEVRKKDA